MQHQSPKARSMGGIMSLPYDCVCPKAFEDSAALRTFDRQSDADGANAVALCMAAVLCCFPSSLHSDRESASEDFVSSRPPLAQLEADRSKRGSAVRLAVAEIVHNEITKEVGRIVRIVNIHGPGYIVAKANKPSGAEIEALWRPRELKELRDRARRYRTAIGNKS
jgi:hypothetical protein